MGSDTGENGAQSRRRDLDEIGRQLANDMRRECPHMHIPLSDLNLVDVAPFGLREVRMVSSEVEKFRNHYAQLQAFAAVVCGVTPETLCAMDMAQALYEGIKPPATFEELLTALSVLDLGGAQIVRTSGGRAEASGRGPDHG